MKTKNVLDSYDAALHEAAMAKAESTRSTPREREIAMRVKARVANDLARLRRDLSPAAEPPVRAQPIRASLLALARDALLALLEEITTRMGGAVQYAHRDLRGLTDDDLRQLIDLLENPTTTE